MHPRLFRLFEILQRIDDRLRLAQQRAAATETDRLRRLKAKVKRLIARFASSTALPQPRTARTA